MGDFVFQVYPQPLDEEKNKDLISNLPNTYIIGAGFSKGWNSQKVPVMSDFFKIAFDAGVMKRIDNKGELEEYIENHFGDFQSANLETVATFLQSRFFPESVEIYAKNEYLYKQLIKIIQEVLGNIHHQPLTTDIKEIYANFANRLIEEKAIIISFNYDLLLDNCLSETKNWGTKTGYGVFLKPFDEIEPMPNWKKMFFSRSAILLKLHGSLNWGIPIIPDIYDGRKVMLASDMIIPVNITNSLPNPSDVSTTYMLFIIPPLINKSDYEDSDLIKNLWHTAYEKLRISKLISILGYSFPPSDYVTEFLIRKAVANGKDIFGPKNKRTIKCVNKSITPEYQNRVRSLFGDANYIFEETDITSFLSKQNWKASTKEVSEHSG